MALHNQTLSLNLVWTEDNASAVVPVTDTKYKGGWEDEIPTYQHFNYVLQGLDTNIKQIAVHEELPWQVDIEYDEGARVKSNGLCYTNIATNTGGQLGSPIIGNIGFEPSANPQKWSLAPNYGHMEQTVPGFGTQPVSISKAHGLIAGNLNPTSENLWGSNAITLTNQNAVMGFNVTNQLHDNWLLGNVQGKMVVVNTGTVHTPTGLDITTGGGNYPVHELLHTGNIGSQLSGEVNALPNTIAQRDGAGQIKATSYNISGSGVTQGTGNENYILAGSTVQGTYKPTSLNALLAGSNNAASGVPIGTIAVWCGGSVPSGWLKCNGALLATGAYSTLFNLIGTTYGSGFGASFKIPDFRGRFVKHWQSGQGNLSNRYSSKIGTHNHRVNTPNRRGVKVQHYPNGIDVLTTDTGSISYTTTNPLGMAHQAGRSEPAHINMEYIIKCAEQ